jgi:hypothetical protein
MILPIVSFVAILANLVLGLFILQKNPKSATNKLFSLFCGATVLWTLFNYFSLQPPSDTLIIHWLRAHLASATIVSATFLLFIYNFPYQKSVFNKRVLVGYLGIVLATIVATLSPFVFE